jgi:hypothetical protein
MQTVAQERLSFGRDPLVLVGDPRHCRGIVRVHNPCADPVKLRRLMLRTPGHDRLSSGCDDGVVVNVAAALCPGETRLLRVSVQLAPGTPPGDYQAYLDGEGKVSVPVTLSVLEHRRVRLSPGAAEFTCCPGDVLTLRTTASNLGNVAVTLPRRAVVQLHPGDRGLLHHFHAAVGAHAEDGYQQFLNGLVRRMGREEPPLGRARLLSGHGPLPAQDARLLEVEVELPKRLRTRRKYLAIVRLAGARLHLTLHVTAPHATSSVPG